MRSLVVAFVVYAAVGMSLNGLTGIGELYAGLIGAAAALLAGYAARRRPSEPAAAGRASEEPTAWGETDARSGSSEVLLGPGAAGLLSPHESVQPSVADLGNQLAAETSYARSNVYVVSGAAEQVYESSMRQRGFDMAEFEDYVDLVCSRLADLREQDPDYVDGQIAEWVEIVQQTAARNGLTNSIGFREKWGNRPRPGPISNRRDTLALAHVRYLESERADPDGDDLWQNLASLLPFAVGIGEGALIPPQVRVDIASLGPAGVYDRIEEIGLTVARSGRGERTPLLFTEILGLCWNMLDVVERDPVADHRRQVLDAMAGQPAGELRAPGSSFFEACQAGAVPGPNSLPEQE